MEEREFEILSRYVDDDLGDTERAALEQRIGQRPDLKSALDDLISMRSQVRQLARNEDPPETLDALVRPLRRSGRPQLRQSTLVPVAAAAAVVIFAVVLGLEIGRHGPLPDSSNPAQRPTAFALKALPEADDSSLVGALEHLMAMPYPEPDMVEPEAMIVIGPLPAPPEFYRQRLELEIGSVRLPLTAGDHLPGLVVELSVADGRFIACRAVEGSDGSAPPLCAAVVGTTVSGVPDGDYRATVAIAR